MLDWISNLITTLLSSDWKYPAILLSGLIEGTPFLGTMFPGGTISLIIGTYVSTHLFNPWGAVLLLLIGNFIGDMIGYGMGRLGQRIGFVRRAIEKENFNSAWVVFEKRLFYFVVLGRLLPVVRSVPSLLAGARLIPVRRYVVYSFAGSALWSFAGIWGGVITRAIVGPHAWVVIVVVTVVAVLWGVVKKRRNN